MSEETLRECLRQYSARQNETVSVIADVVCTCRSASFRLHLHVDDEGARRVCAHCGAKAFIADSEEYWDESDFDEAECPCGQDVYTIAVGFDVDGDGEVRWIYVAGKCEACGLDGVYVDWKINYLPSQHLLSQA